MNSIESLGQTNTLVDLLNWRITQTPQLEAYRQYNASIETWQSFTWAQIGSLVQTWRNALTPLRLLEGARIAILLPNGINAVCIDQASLASGFIPVPMHSLDNPASIAYIIKDSDASVLFVSALSEWEAIKGIGAELPELQYIVVNEDDVFPQGDSNAPAIIHLSTWLSGGAPSDPLSSTVILSEALAAIVYTSGTTGRPKGVMLTHRNVLSNIKAVFARVEVFSTDVFLSFLPLSHTFERTAGYYLPIAAGSCVAFARSVAQIPEDLKLIRPTVLISVPRIYERVYVKLQEKIAQSSELTQRLFTLTQTVGWRHFCQQQQLPYDKSALDWLDPLLLPCLRWLVARKVLALFGGRLRAAICGGAPLSQPLAECFLALGIPLLQGYGMTETSPIVCCNMLDDNWPLTVGKALDHIDVRLGENDELQVHGDCVMAGYWKRPEDTEKTMTLDGWLRTGDQANLDGGRIQIIGRIKDIIVTSTGEKISPSDLELAISADPLFSQVFIIGENRPFISVFVVLNQEIWKNLYQQSNGYEKADLSLNSAFVQTTVLAKIQEATKSFPYYAIPRVVKIAPEPWSLQNGLMTPTLKLKRKALLAHFEVEIEDIYKQRTSGE
ncbi:MAG: long-chain fatty acid--CoA ligase [Candidatus Saccharibacteria bacterium]|nr:long-chain fatty acid--CoA ligase [Moraxellaceae bacterium]